MMGAMPRPYRNSEGFRGKRPVFLRKRGRGTRGSTRTLRGSRLRKTASVTAVSVMRLSATCCCVANGGIIYVVDSKRELARGGETFHTSLEVEAQGATRLLVD